MCCSSGRLEVALFFPRWAGIPSQLGLSSLRTALFQLATGWVLKGRASALP